MGIKKRNINNSILKDTTPKKEVSFEEAEKLANEMADKPYGETVNPREQEEERLTISLSGALYDAVNELARERKRRKIPNKSMSGIVREAITQYLNHNS